MSAMERLGSYISRGVNTVSGPFHPFGGAIDIVVVKQLDGSFKSSPWYVRFGKFQGVLKAKEKVVNVSVNGVEANFHMYLDHKGEAYFLKEVDAEGDDSMLSPSSSGEEMDGQWRNRRPVKSKSCNYDANLSNSVTQIDASNGKVVARTGSRRSRILGLVFGRKTMKDRLREEEDGTSVVRADSLERAEIAADLLEMKWSTNLASGRHRKDNTSSFSALRILDGEANKDSQIKNGQGQVDSLVHDNITNSVDNSVSQEVNSGSSHHGMGKFSQSSLQTSERSVEATGVEMPCLITGFVIGTSTLGESGLEGNAELNSEMSIMIHKIGVANADSDENTKGVISETVSPKSLQISDSAKLEACHVFDNDAGLPDSSVSSEENEAGRLSCETLESSRIGLDGFGEQVNETVNLSCGKCEVSVHAETLHDTTESISEVNSQPETDLLAAKEPETRNLFNNGKLPESEGTPNTTSFVTEAYSEMVTVHPMNSSIKEVESCNIFNVSSFSNSICQVHDEKSIKKENNLNKLRPSLGTVDDSLEVTCDFVPSEAINILPSEDSEEQLLFGDLDDFKLSEVKCMDSISLNHTEKENCSTHTLEGLEAVNEFLSSNYESDPSPAKFVLEVLPNDVEESRQKSKIISSDVEIPRSGIVAGEEVRRMAESLPNMWSHFNDLDALHLHCSLGRSLELNSKSSSRVLLRKDVPCCIKSDADKEHKSFNSQPTIEDAPISEELKNVLASPAVGDPSQAIDASSGSQRLWSDPLKRSRIMKVTQPSLNCTRNTGVENALEITCGMDVEKDVPEPKANKKKIRAITPTSEQLASLNLKEGRNTVTFTFSTAMLGKQQVDARIYLWRLDTRIVISDVDGTITKSDVLGQFMPLVGRDWSQTGVAHLYSAIKENGYQLLFLSARAISQAGHTRQFLFNLKQDGKALPDGPVFISPDGIFPSLFREVIRRAPHEFKIACLEDIRALFPPDRNPFYAGFGNRDTDEFSYLKVGIPKGKIFIINPKGEVAVNRRVDTKSYTSLRALVNGMFPPMSSSEQEDFNSWNYWKLPPPAINT